MPNLSSRSKHVEFESNSALQIRKQKERRAEKAGKSRISQKGAKMLLDFLPFGTPFDFPFVIFSHFALHVLWVLRAILYFCLFEHYISSNQIL